jgi:hypothetical protein
MKLTKTASLSVSALLLALGASNAFALPAFPGAVGFASEITGGRGGTVYKVTNLNESGSGSLAACVQASGPRVCVFEVSGTIRLTNMLAVKNPNLTIAGQTAPSPGIIVRGAPLDIITSNVIVQHLRFRIGDDGPLAADQRDGLTIWGAANNPVNGVLVDHCSFSWSVDEIVSAWDNWTNVTFSNNIFAEPLNESIHQEAHGFGPIFGGANPGNVSVIGNLFADMLYRNPYSMAKNFVMVNNVIFNRGDAGVTLQSADDGAATTNSIVGNVFLKGPNYGWSIPPIYIEPDAYGRTWASGTKLYQADNISDEPYSGGSIVTRGDGLSYLWSIVTSPPVWHTGLTAKPTANNVVYNSVLANSGARPADREPVDTRIVNQVKSRQGQIINCVSADGSSRCAKNAGGWPNLAQNTRALSVPANPNATAANGYTNLENWLNQYSAVVEGRATVAAPNPPSNISIQ